MVIDQFGVPNARSSDQEADVLYVNLKKPTHVDESEMTDDDDVIIRNEKGLVVGMIFLNASKRRKALWPNPNFPKTNLELPYYCFHKSTKPCPTPPQRGASPRETANHCSPHITFYFSRINSRN
jgi:uncharacterized protein YuzE